MSGIVIIDSNLLVLLMVGSASKEYVAKHKNTKDHFTVDDFDLLGLLIKDFSEIVVVAHVVAETSNLIRQIGEPKKTAIQNVLSTFVANVYEVPTRSVDGINREEYLDLGITDAVILVLCSLTVDGVSPTLLTADSRLANRASSLGYSVIDFKQEFQS